jgi:hypothetical protein
MIHLLFHEKIYQHHLPVVYLTTSIIVQISPV